MSTVVWIISFGLGKSSYQVKVERNRFLQYSLKLLRSWTAHPPEEYVSQELYPKAMPISTLSFPHLLAKLMTFKFSPLMGTLLRLSGSFYIKDLDPNHLEKVNSVFGTEFKRNGQEGVTITWKKHGGVDKALGT